MSHKPKVNLKIFDRKVIEIIGSFFLISSGIRKIRIKRIWFEYIISNFFLKSIFNFLNFANISMAINFVGPETQT